MEAVGAAKALYDSVRRDCDPYDPAMTSTLMLWRESETVQAAVDDPGRSSSAVGVGGSGAEEGSHHEQAIVWLDEVRDVTIRLRKEPVDRRSSEALIRWLSHSYEAATSLLAERPPLP